MTPRLHRADHAWLPDGFADGVLFGTDAQGLLQLEAEAPAAAAAERLAGFVLPGMPNLHSHAFQRAMAGLAERRGEGEDSFWTWREVMYAFAGRIGPDDLQAIAAQLYVEMLQAGYTQVCEFHYLHQQPDGRPYADPACMSLALVEAAREAGIGLTLLPVLYMAGGFDGRALSTRQQRFGHGIEDYLRLVDRLATARAPGLAVGMALHSLRAVPPDAMQAVLAADPAPHGPIHIHVAEQLPEVAECVERRGARPVQWLLDNAHVDARWCLVHATHLDATEVQRLAASGAVAGLCPTTEANLGDGLFPLRAYLDAGGRVGIGSDSHISVSPVEELRWLEYGQRLATHQRNVAADARAGTGEALLRATLAGGAQACGTRSGVIATGARGDLVVLDDEAPLLAARGPGNAIDTWIFAGNTPLVRHVMAGGQWQVRDFHHRDGERIAARYKATVQRLARQA
jgi:formimidoylglutamate deiminase